MTKKMTENFTETKMQVMPIIKALELGETARFPLSRRAYVRSVCYAVGVETEKEFKTQTLCALKAVQVVRTR